MGFDGGARVLVADADPGLRRQLHKRLLDGEIFSDCVANGRDAVAILREQRFAVVLLDLGLGDLAAEQILDAIREVPAGERPVVLVLAGPSAARTLDIDLVQIVLRKPCNLAQIAELVRSCVQTAATHRELLGAAPQAAIA